MSGWSPDGPVAEKLPIRGWWATVQNTLVDTGVGTDAVIERPKERLVDQGRGSDRASAHLLSPLLSSDTGIGTDRLPMYPKFNGSEGATGSDLARVGSRVFDEGRGIDTANTKYRVLGLDLALGYDLSTARKVGQRPWDAARGYDVATNGWHAQSATNQTFTAAGTYTIPYWCRYIDLVLVGGGASGQTGNGGNGQAGKGGNASSWVTVTLERGVDIALTAISLTVAVGAGGLTPANSDFAGPNAGAASSVSGSGITTVSTAGGSGTRGDQNGASPGNVSYQGIVLAGGSAGTGNAGVGQAPNASGAGGNDGFFYLRTKGGAGARGVVVIQARQ